MTVHRRPALLALFLLLGCLAVLLFVASAEPLWAGPKPVPARTAQIISPEPPLQAVPAPGSVAAPPGSPCPVDPPIPVVALRVRVPASIGPNQEIEYRIVVENSGQADAHQVVVRNPLPANARFVRAQPEPTVKSPDLAWNLGTLSGCSGREIVLVVAATGAGDVHNCARVQFEHGQCTLTRIIRPRLAVRICGPTQAALNEVLNFQIAVSNRGEVEATGVGLIEKLPDGLEHASGKNTLAWDIGALAPGQCRTVEYQVTARKPGRSCMRVAASANDSAFDETEACVDVGQQPVQPGQPVQPIQPGQPIRPAPVPGSLSLIKRGPEQRALRNPATYQITVQNNGAMPATNVVITDILPPRTNIVSISDAGRSSGEQVQWAIGTVPPGARRTVQIALQAQAAGEVVNRATVTADGGLTASDQARTVFEGAAGLTFDIEAKDNPVEVGATTSYLVTVLNQGVAPATKVRISVTLPEGVEMLGAKGPSNHKQEGRQVTFEPLPALAAGKEERYEINIKAQRAGQVKCRAELRADQLGDRPVVREQSTTIYDPGSARPATTPPIPAPTPPPN